MFYTGNPRRTHPIRSVPNEMIRKSMDCLGENLQENHIFNGKNHGFL